MGTPTPGKQMWENQNVYNKPLHLFSREPMTGAFRDGYCRTGPDDPGNHSVAATLTKEFLDFTNSKGNNLSSLSPGTKWCLCASRWKEAMAAAKDANDPVVPKVYLHATAKESLDVVDMADLKKYAAEGEAGGSGGSNSGRAPRGMAGLPKKQTVHEMNQTGGLARDQHPDASDDPEENLDAKMYSGRRATPNAQGSKGEAAQNKS